MSSPGVGDLLAVGDRRPDLDALPAAAGQRARDIVAGRRLDADHTGRRRERLDRGRGARDQPAPAHRHHDGVERATVNLVEQLQRRRALPGHHERVVVGVHQRQPARAGELVHQVLAVLAVAVVGDDLGPVALGRRAFERRRVGRHQDHSACAVQARRQRDRLGVVARGDRADAASQRVRAQRGHRVEGAAELERATALQRFDLEHELGAADRVERLRRHNRSAVRDALKRRGSAADVCQLDRRRGRQTPKPRCRRRASTDRPRRHPGSGDPDRGSA